MQSVMQMFVARFASRNPCISRMPTLPKKPKDSLYNPKVCHFSTPGWSVEMTGSRLRVT